MQAGARPAAPPPRSLPASLQGPAARPAGAPAQVALTQPAALLQAAAQHAPHLFTRATTPLVGFAGGAGHLQPAPGSLAHILAGQAHAEALRQTRQAMIAPAGPPPAAVPGSLEHIRAAQAHAEALRRTQLAMIAAGPPPRATAERSLPPSLAQPLAAAAGPSGGAAGQAAPDAPDNRAAMQAVVDALSVCSSEPADPPEGALKVSLLRHQRLALGWLLAREGTGKGARAHCPNGGILADDQVRDSPRAESHHGGL